jgi:hypothetical protein
MEKRSRRRIRNLVALAAFKGLSENEIGCARISMMAGSDAAPSKGRIQKRKTNPLQIVKSSLQRTAGPYKSATTGLMHRSNWRLFDLRRHRDYSACTCTGAPRFPTVPGAITR